MLLARQATPPIKRKPYQCAAEEWHSKTISKKFAEHLGSKRIICLNIPDEFERMDPTLVSILKSKVPPFLD